jgi:2,5-furandicarboxylate decarboxylase 1
MDLRSFVDQARSAGELLSIARPVDPRLEMAPLIAALEGKAVFFPRVKGSAFPVVVGVCSDRRLFALALGCQPGELLLRLTEALAQRRPPPLVESAPCQEVIEPAVDLTALPFLTHWPNDAGPYATAAVVFIDDPDTGPSAAFHRLLRLDERRLAARLVEGRGTHTAWRKARTDVPVAICIGLPPHVLLAAAMSPAPSVDEMTIAQALAPTPLVHCRTVPLKVPAVAEFVLEGRLTHQMVAEGPFVDLTGTYDIVRQQPVIEVDAITHRRSPLYQALLPGGLEHKLLMGMPREPTIYAAVSEVCQCRNVHITPGGTSWLHAVVQIEKRRPDDGLRAGEAAFRGHSSLKHVVVVDDDVDPFDAQQVEWAIATRFQAARDALVLENQPSSSLDPSAEHTPGQKARTSKMVIDATIPWDRPDGPSQPAGYRRIRSSSVDVSAYLDPNDVLVT